MHQLTCCCFDLETSNLDADFGIVLCGVIKAQGKTTKVFRGDAYPTWRRRRSDDRLILQDLCGELERYDVWCAHNGRDFDVKFLRTRLARWGLPPLVKRKLIDPLLLARNKFRMSYHSLDSLARMLNLPPKTPLRGPVWVEAALDGSRRPSTRSSATASAMSRSWNASSGP
jgi:uncharacterized protein YprB with RNaseH-like and TPR domain